MSESVLAAHQEMTERHDVSLRSALGERLVPGDPLLLERLVGNLVANAITYNSAGGWVEVEVVVATEPALTVRNSGQRVPAEAALAGAYDSRMTSAGSLSSRRPL